MDGASFKEDSIGGDFQHDSIMRLRNQSIPPQGNLGEMD